MIHNEKIIKDIFTTKKNPIIELVITRNMNIFINKILSN